MSLASVIDAITRLGDRVAANSGGAAKTTTALPAVGTLGMSGFTPTVTLAEVVDPKDFFRISGVIVVDTPTANVYYGDPQSLLGRGGVATRQTFPLDCVGGVGANGKTVQLPPLIAGLSSKAGATISVAGDPGYIKATVSLQNAAPTFISASSSITLLTRYHYG